MKHYCPLCGYIYDPEKGDTSSEIEPNIKFEDIPDNWVYSICGADKSVFKTLN